ncbi:glutamine synthetase family protein [Actinoplanes sp. NBRC 103695]|uniref:glutamine synthetase family protein n=1 Tax=Actinoplanes sp. NBRC 103695 TaxID=3032202 RepID=UPI0024A5B115|nr:glutamine synthetase family protein [Actinoplanes sp. NBRC 103695]GLY96552.1 glutamine synthetase [Actinoplanes sp. NBRC 103695]
MDLEELAAAVKDGTVDTVLLAITDMQGRLQGKRLHARHFVEEVAERGAEVCNYLLAADVEMATLGDFAGPQWHGGYGDYHVTPDLGTLRLVPWHPATALVLADLETTTGEPVSVAPRQILRHQLDRLAAHGLTAHAGTELEFVLFRGTYEQAAVTGYRWLTPATRYNGDYSLLDTAQVEPLLRRLRNDMYGAGLSPESAKGECNLGQYEVTFRYADALTAADHHVIYKNGAKEIAAQEGMALTFMAKPNEREGNSCHIHFSLRDDTGSSVMAGDGIGNLSLTGQRALAGVLATMREFSLFNAPNINSYKRYQPGSFAPTALRWGVDNRTCALRVVGDGPSKRVENRVPGGDVNPYLAIAALIAGALHGIEEELFLEDVFTGDAYGDNTATRPPATLREAVELWNASKAAQLAFGPDVQAHYATTAAIELAAFDAAVTDWELRRGFERL